MNRLCKDISASASRGRYYAESDFPKAPGSLLFGESLIFSESIWLLVSERLGDDPSDASGFAIRSPAGDVTCVRTRGWSAWTCE